MLFRSFKSGYVDDAPASNADIAHTLAKALGLNLSPKGKLSGRALGESLKGGATISATRKTVTSAPGEGGLTTVLEVQQVGTTRYFDAAGFPGRTVGLGP